MRTLLLAGYALFVGAASAQNACTSSAQAERLRNLRSAQTRALAIPAATIDSGIPDKVAPVLIHLKAELARIADIAVLCGPADATAKQVQSRIDALLHQATPGMPEPKQSSDDKDWEKPRKGLFGNNVSAKVSFLIETPHLLEVDISSSEVCGEDTQLLIYEQRNGHWQRALRWSSAFTGKDSGGSWGDFILTKIVIPNPAHPDLPTEHPGAPRASAASASLYSLPPASRIHPE
jgi:hypothetical protein